MEGIVCDFSLVTRNVFLHFPILPFGSLGQEGDYAESAEFFRARFMRLNRSEHKEVYVHYTDATDTNLLRNIMASVNDIILQRNVSVLAL